MLKILLKRQIYELNQRFFINKTTGTVKTKEKAILTIVGFIFLMVCISASFVMLAYTFLISFQPLGLTWLYFSFMGTFALLMGVIGSVFNTYSTLYKSKDNELLLSMPIKPNAIIISRLLSVYLMGLLFTSIIMLPSLILFYIFGSPNFLSVLFSILLYIVISILVLVFSCILGYIVAKISLKLKHKNAVITILSILIFGAYFYFCGNFGNYIQSLIVNGEGFGESIKIYAYPLYIMGKMGAGDALSALYFCLAAILLLLIIYCFINKSFYKIITSVNLVAKSKYNIKKEKNIGYKKALLKKELAKYFSSSVYMLNSSFGIILMPVCVIFALIKGKDIASILPALGDISQTLPVIIFAAIALISSSNNITSPSISLESKNLWIIKSLPINLKDVLFSKVKMHIILTLPLSLILSVVLCIVFNISWVNSILIFIGVILFVFSIAFVGIILNLKYPNLNYTSEIYAVKQSTSVFFSLFGAWIFSIILGILGYFVCKVLPSWAVLVMFSALLLILDLIFKKYIETKGKAIFENL